MKLINSEKCRITVSHGAKRVVTSYLSANNPKITEDYQIGIILQKYFYFGKIQ